MITGLVWEIFNMLDEKTKEVLAEHQERENENIQRIKEKNTFKHETFHRQKTITQAKRNTRRISIMSELAEENSQKSESCSSKYSKQLSAENKSKESHSDAVKNDEVEENNESSVEKLEVKDLSSVSSSSQNSQGKLPSSHLHRGSIFGTSGLSLDDGYYKTTNEANETNPESVMDWMKKIKGQYILRETLLKDAKDDLKKDEADYLKNNFRAYETMAGEVIDKWEEQTHITIHNTNFREGLLILHTLRYIYIYILL